MKRILWALLACVLVLTGCKGKAKRNLLPNVSGKAGEVLVVIEKADWEAELGSAIREALGSDTPYLAQREPLFSLSNVPPGSFSNNMFKVHRNILLVSINPQGLSFGVQYHNNVWAQPQAVIQINAPSSAEALTLFQETASKAAEFFEQSERDRIIANAKLYEERQLRAPVEKVTGGILHFPSGYVCRKYTDDFVWIADEKQYTNQTVLIYKYPATDAAFTLEGIIAERDAVMKANVPGPSVGSYMTTSLAQEPTLQSLRYRGRAFMETRGFWEVQGDFMGGPFVSHSFYSPDGQYIIVLEAFVYAPRYDKRQYLRQVEALLYSFEWVKEDEK